MILGITDPFFGANSNTVTVLWLMLKCMANSGYGILRMWLRITPPAVTAMICFGSIICYTYYIMSKTNFFDWLPEFLLPMMILTAAFISLDVALIGGKKIKGLHIFSLLSLECAVYLISWEVILDNLKFGEIDLGWSLILSCGFISVVAVLEAFSYVGRINKK